MTAWVQTPAVKKRSAGQKSAGQHVTPRSKIFKNHRAGAFGGFLGRGGRLLADSQLATGRDLSPIGLKQGVGTWLAKSLLRHHAGLGGNLGGRLEFYGPYWRN